ERVELTQHPRLIGHAWWLGLGDADDGHMVLFGDRLHSLGQVFRCLAIVYQRPHGVLPEIGLERGHLLGGWFGIVLDSELDFLVAYDQTDALEQIIRYGLGRRDR